MNMDYAPHWATLCICNGCGEIPETAPMYHCPFQHQYCLNCFNELKRNYRGIIEEGCTCLVCKVSGKFQLSKINTDFLKKLKVKPGIGRPCRYSTNVSAMRGNKKDLNLNSSHDEDVTVESLFQLPTEQIQQLLNRKSKPDLHESDEDGFQSSTTKGPSRSSPPNIPHPNQPDAVNLRPIKSNATLSKKPLKCPHNLCKKTVAISSFVSHFKHEHTDIPKLNVERGKELCIPCDVSIIEHNTDICLAMITVYEINKIDVVRSRSSQSVIKTCNKFCQKVPINTFWLMVSGSLEKKPHCAFAYFWLFTSSDECYQNTIELASKCDGVSLSTFCGVNTSSESDDVASSLNCLLLSRSSIVALLKEGTELNLRVTIH